ncbi:MAG: hypothetical protein Q8Q12_07295 [bacterium]|nr:hypothetical protein [bacterium]
MKRTSYRIVPQARPGVPASMISAVKKASSRGIALLLTLGILLLLTLLALSFSSSQLTENEAAENFYYAAKAEEIALGGLDTAAALLRKDAAGDRQDQRHSGGNRPASDDLFERWAIYYEGKNGFAPDEDDPDEDEAADLSDYDEFLYRVDERGRLDLTGMKDPWKDTPELDSRWIEVVAQDPVTGEKRVIGRFAVCVEDENAKVNINTAGNPDPLSSGGQWVHRQGMGYTTSEIDLGDILSAFGLLFENTLDDVQDYPYNADYRTALDIVAYRYGARARSEPLAPGEYDRDDNVLPRSGRGQVNLLPQDENAIDDDGDRLIDEGGEEKDEPGEFAPYEPLEIQPPGRLLRIENPRTGGTGVMWDDTPYLTVSHVRMRKNLWPGAALRDLKPPYPQNPLDRLYRSLLPFITVSSLDLNRFSNLDVGRRGGRGVEIEWYIRENIGRWLKGGPSEIEDALREFDIRFDDSDTLKQVAVNLYDFIDPDWFPTEEGGLIGLEPTIYINEVEPSPPDLLGTQVGLSEEVVVRDLGEYIELWNPYAIALDIANYSLTIDSGSPKRVRDIVGGSTTVIIPPRTFFVIGDRMGDVVNIGQGSVAPDQNLPPYPPGCQAYAELKLAPNQEMVLEMQTASGKRVIEKSKLNAAASADNLTSQKNDPRMPKWDSYAGTLGGMNPTSPLPASQVYSSFYIPGIRQRAFEWGANAATLAMLERAGALHTVGELGMVHRGQAWRTLNFTGEEQLGYSDSDSENDVRLLDILTLPYPYQNRGLRDDEELKRDGDVPQPKVVPGRININTASPQVLMGLNWRPMIDEIAFLGQGGRGPALRDVIIGHILERRRDKPYQNLADVAQDIAEFIRRYRAISDPTEAVQEAFIRYNSNLITTRSNVFKVTVLAQAFDRKGNIAAERKLEAVIDRGYTPGDFGRQGEKSWNRQDQARFEMARTLYFRWVTED